MLSSACTRHLKPRCAPDVVSAAAAPGAETATEPKVTNPPMIHSLAVSSSSEGTAAQLVAAACGDGTVAVWDLDKVHMALCSHLTALYVVDPRSQMHRHASCMHDRCAVL